MRIADTVLQSVAFIGIKQEGRFSPRATAFFAVIEQGGFQFLNLVTAEHVISGLVTRGHTLWLRVNCKDGKVREGILRPEGFYYHPDNERDPTDVAVCPTNHFLADDETGEHHEMAISPLVLTAGHLLPDAAFFENVGLGSEVAVVGLFRSHYGNNKNIPIVRSGNLAAMMDEPIFTKYAGYIKAYLIEARSIAGLSGSPVLAMPSMTVAMAKKLRGENIKGIALLGLMHGHFDVQNLNEDVVADSEKPERSVHTGIGVVVPTDKIMEVINQRELKEMRDEIIENVKKANGATADSDEVAEHLPATDANPTHREDFNSLLGAAARKPRSGD